MSNRIQRGGLVVILLIGMNTVIGAQAPFDGSQVRFRSDVEVVGVSVTVRDRRDRLVTDLTRDDFRLVVNRRPVVRRRAADEDVLLYGLIPRSVTNETPSDRPMRRLAYETGGGYLRLGQDDEELASIMAGVVEELRHEYVLGFSPAERDGRDRTVSVQVTRPGLTARARRTYRLAAPPSRDDDG